MDVAVGKKDAIGECHLNNNSSSDYQQHIKALHAENES